MHNKNKIVNSLLVILIFTFICFAQDKEKVPSVIDPGMTSSCPYVSAIYDSFVQGTPIDKNIIIISYKGEEETKADITERRLYNAKLYFTEFYKNTRFSRPENKIITAVGVDITEEGKIEFYVDGELQLTFLFKKNRDFILPPCYTESEEMCKDKLKKMFYPCYKPTKSNS